MATAQPIVAQLDAVTGAILETPELRAQGLAAFRALIAAEQAKKPFRLVREDDAFLLAFLRARKYEVARALPVLQGFGAFWYTNEVLLSGVTLADIRHTYELEMVRILDAKE